MIKRSRPRSILIAVLLLVGGCGDGGTGGTGGGGRGGTVGGGGRGGASGGGRGGAGGVTGTAGTTGGAGTGGTGGSAGAGGAGGTAAGGTGGSAGSAGTSGTSGAGGAAGRGGSGGSAGAGGGTAGSGGTAGTGGGAAGTGGSTAGTGGGTAGTGGGNAGTGGTAGTGGSTAGTGGGAAGTGGSAGTGGTGGSTAGTGGSTAGTGGGTAGTGGGTAGTGGGAAGTGGGAAGTGGGLAGPSITATNYSVAAHGMDLIITGTNLTGATALTIGGTAHVPNVMSSTQVTVHVSDATPIGQQAIVITTPGGSSPPFGITIIHLIINELDSDTPGNDTAEFVEIATGVANVSLAGYTLVFWNGTADTAYLAINLNATTNAAGMLTAGNAALAPTLTFADNTLQNGADAVGVYAAPTSTFPVGSIVSATSLIDAVVYDTADADDAGLLDALLGLSAPGRVQVDEALGSMSDTQSIQRCGTGRLDGRQFVVGTPSPGAANTAPCI